MKRSREKLEFETFLKEQLKKLLCGSDGQTDLSERSLRGGGSLKRLPLQFTEIGQHETLGTVTQSCPRHLIKFVQTAKLQ